MQPIAYPNSLDAVAASPAWGPRRWDPRFKLVLLVGVVALNVGLARLWLSITLMVLGLLLALFARIAARRIGLFLLAPAWATAMVVVGFSVGFGQTPLAALGPFTVYQEGLILGAAAAARVACDVIWLATIFLTTPFNEVLSALRWFRMPDVLLDMVAMAYRYAFLLYDEFIKMRQAARCRGGFRDLRSACQSTAMILSQVILRAYDRARRIQYAMTARGESAGPLTASEPGAEPVPCPNDCDITPERLDRSTPVLVCHQVGYAFGSVKSLHDISMTVHSGDLLVLCGPNGAGKTTLLRLIAGILVPNRGEIHLRGQPLNRDNRARAFRHVGILSQDPDDQLFCTHVRDDIAYGPLNLGLDPQELERRVRKAMELMEVEHLAHRPIHSLSHGEKKRVGLAGILAMQPPMILLDEPTASLDPAASRHLTALIQHLNHHHGYTLMIVTHDINLAATLAKRLVILDGGTIAADGIPREILTNQRLLENSRLEPPILTRLFQQLGELNGGGGQIPVTVEEAAALLNYCDLFARLRCN